MKVEMTINEIQKFTYLFQALKGVQSKTKDLSKLFIGKDAWRIKTAMTNLDKAVASVLESMDPDVFRQMKYINDTHETIMIPKKEKLKHLKNLESIDHLFTIRDAVVRNKCNECVEKDKNACRIHNMLQKAGTPYFWDMDNLDVLPEEHKKIAEHCGYCGGFFNERL